MPALHNKAGHMVNLQDNQEAIVWPLSFPGLEQSLMLLKHISICLSVFLSTGNGIEPRNLPENTHSLHKCASSIYALLESAQQLSLFLVKLGEQRG